MYAKAKQLKKLHNDDTAISSKTVNQLKTYITQMHAKPVPTKSATTKKSAAKSKKPKKSTARKSAPKKSKKSTATTKSAVKSKKPKKSKKSTAKKTVPKKKNINDVDDENWDDFIDPTDDYQQIEPEDETDDEDEDTEDEIDLEDEFGGNPVFANEKDSDEFFEKQYNEAIRGSKRKDRNEMLAKIHKEAVIKEAITSDGIQKQKCKKRCKKSKDAKNLGKCKKKCYKSETLKTDKRNRKKCNDFDLHDDKVQCLKDADVILGALQNKNFDALTKGATSKSAPKKKATKKTNKTAKSKSNTKSNGPSKAAPKKKATKKTNKTAKSKSNTKSNGPSKAAKSKSAPKGKPAPKRITPTQVSDTKSDGSGHAEKANSATKPKGTSREEKLNKLKLPSGRGSIMNRMFGL